VAPMLVFSFYGGQLASSFELFVDLSFNDGDGQAQGLGDREGRRHRPGRADDRCHRHQHVLNLFEGHPGVHGGPDVQEVRSGFGIHGGKSSDANRGSWR
jgi:hypothetical protein